MLGSHEWLANTRIPVGSLSRGEQLLNALTVYEIRVELQVILLPGSTLHCLVCALGLECASNRSDDLVGLEALRTDGDILLEPGEIVILNQHVP